MIFFLLIIFLIAVIISDINTVSMAAQSLDSQAGRITMLNNNQKGLYNAFVLTLIFLQIENLPFPVEKSHRITRFSRDSSTKWPISLNKFGMESSLTVRFTVASLVLKFTRFHCHVSDTFAGDNVLFCIACSFIFRLFGSNFCCDVLYVMPVPTHLFYSVALFSMLVFISEVPILCRSFKIEPSKYFTSPFLEKLKAKRISR